MKQKTKIIITGGHFTPALALINQIKKVHGNWEIYYFGLKKALENSKQSSYEFETLSQDKQIHFITFNAGKIQRRLTPKSLISLIKIPFSFLIGFYQVLLIKPKIIISFGGNLSVPIITSGWLMKIPTITHEQTSTIGLANKINALFVDKFAVSFPDLSNKSIAKKRIFTGNPIRKEVFNKQPIKSSLIYKKWQENKKPVIYITGGKTGSKIINQTIKKTVSLLINKYFVIHQFGLDAETQLKPLKGYMPIKFITSDEIGWVMNMAKIVISRAGANTVFELLALDKPSVLIPIPWSSKNEQYKNALFLKNQGLAEILPQDKLTKKSLLAKIAKIEKNYKNYQAKKGFKIDLKTADKNLLELAEEVVHTSYES